MAPPKKRPDRSRVVNVRLSDALYAALQLEAVESSVTHSDVIRAALAIHLHRSQPEYVSDQELDEMLAEAGFVRDEP